MGFGIPSYGNDTTYYKNYKLKSPDQSKGESVFTLTDLRILPPIHSLAEKGKWCMYHGQHFGYNGNGKEPGKSRPRPFACPLQTDYRTRMVTVPCSACSLIEEKKGEKDAREAEYISQKLSEQEIRERLDPLNQWLKKHNCDRKWHINVVDRSGNYGVLQISHTLKKALDVKMAELRDKRKVDPISATEGVWWRFSRMGKFPVTDSVEWVMTGDDSVGWRIEKAPLTEAQYEEAVKICPDLATGVVKPISAAQINAIIACSGDPDEIDRIWQNGTRTPERSPVTTAAPAAVKPVASAPVDEVEALKKRLAELTAQQNAASVPAVAPTAPVLSGTVASAPAAPASSDVDLSDEDFYAKYAPKR